MPKVQYVGIDFWNRPVFKDVRASDYYSSTEILFRYDASEAEVLNKITADDLTYHGHAFDSEPIGAKISNMEIVRRSDA